ncbi:unnamed protein product, partial [Ectocarpus fasciculatus]
MPPARQLSPLASPPSSSSLPPSQLPRPCCRFHLLHLLRCRRRRTRKRAPTSTPRVSPREAGRAAAGCRGRGRRRRHSCCLLRRCLPRSRKTRRCLPPPARLALLCFSSS